MTVPSGRVFAVISVIYLLLHTSLGLASRLFEIVPGLSLWYPPVGLALAFAIICGWRATPVVLAGNLIASFAVTGSIPGTRELLVVLLVTGAYAGVGGAVHRWFGSLPAPTRPRPSTALVLLFQAPPLIAAVGGAGLLVTYGLIPLSGFARSAFEWWLGDVMGVLTITPLCLVHVGPRLVQAKLPPRRPRTEAQWLELALQMTAIAFCLAILPGVGFLQTSQAFHLCFIPLVWICLRSGLRGATLAIFALTVGPLAVLRCTGAPAGILTDLALFEVSVGCVGLGLASTVSRRALAERERARLLAILEATPDYIATANFSGQILYENAALQRLRGDPAGEPPQGRQLGDYYPPAAAAQIGTEALPTARREGIWEGETTMLAVGGRQVPVAQRVIAHYNEEGQPVMISTVARDLTADKEAERARLESERNLLQSQKLESLGVLAGGIAHDFNNLLTVMLGNATLARLDVPPDSPAERAVHQIELAALRAADLCRQMLAYSGRGQMGTEVVNLSTLVEQTTHLLKVSISKKCALEFDLADNLPPVQGDATQLSQITMNLVINASDACGESGGEVVVRTGLMQADRPYLATTYLAPAIEAGPYVFLEVSDNGCGMTPEVLARIFEPFFTTKFTGHGLGLSAVLGIARSHGGAIKVTSAPGRGTTFRLLLPCSGEVPIQPAAAPAPMPPAWRGSGRVLVVDDEEPVRQIAARILERCGFTPLLAVHGLQAVEMFREAPRGFSAVLLDLTMPVMNGAEAFREIRGLNPEVPVILMSGYNRTDSESRLGIGGLAGFVQKPFDHARLSEALRSALAAPKPGQS